MAKSARRESRVAASGLPSSTASGYRTMVVSGSVALVARRPAAVPHGASAYTSSRRAAHGKPAGSRRGAKNGRLLPGPAQQVAVAVVFGEAEAQSLIEPHGAAGFLDLDRQRVAACGGLVHQVA